ncbi:MAG: zinc-binding dehydrogenase [Dehalococcoidia bacterium]|nr:zinc-binding dehydrogenase [Dehalococcoidia bacterium]
MRAMVLRNKQLTLEDVDTPSPGEGQVLARVLACGVCGSDLHAARFMDEMIAASKASGRTAWDTIDPGKGMVMGHEFVAEVVEAGPGAEDWTPGTRVTSMPVLPDTNAPNGFYSIGYSPEKPGAYGEYVVLSASLLLKVQDGVADTIAATTEPCAVGLHAARAGGMRDGESALVMGAGPIGLMTLLWLKKDGVERVAVSDPSAERRALAGKLGADLVIDPANEDVTATFNQHFGDQEIDRGGAATGRSYGGGAREVRPSVVFECVGVPGTLQSAMELVQMRGRVVVAGVCMEEDRVRPMVGTNKQLNVSFVLGYSAAEYNEALAALTDGSIDPSPMITRTVSLEELPDAFHALSDPRECKVVLVPGQ